MAVLNQIRRNVQLQRSQHLCETLQTVCTAALGDTDKIEKVQEKALRMVAGLSGVGHVIGPQIDEGRTTCSLTGAS
jgi:hypothetical protein